MHILIVAHRPPLLAVDGASMATSSLIVGLREAGHEVQVLTAETDRHPSRTDDPATAELAAATCYAAVHVDTAVTPLRALRGLFQDSYNVRRFDSPELRRTLRQRLDAERFDLVLLDSLFTTPYLDEVRAATTAPVVLRPHNVEHQIWNLLAANSRPPKSWYLRVLARQLRAYEIDVLPRFDAIAAISSDDLDAIAVLAPGVRVGLVEIGMADRYEPAPLRPGAPLCSVATYDWTPNIEGMSWFVDRVWPLVRSAAPEARFDIAGWHSDRFRERFERPGIRVLGPVPSAEAFLAERGILVAPVLSGGGVRVKLIEAMLMGKPIVTTSVGGLGLAGDGSSPLMIRDDPAAFAGAVVELLGEPGAASALGQAARRAAGERFSRPVVTRQLLDLVDGLEAVGP